MVPGNFGPIDIPSPNRHDILNPIPQDCTVKRKQGGRGTRVSEPLYRMKQILQEDAPNESQTAEN